MADEACATFVITIENRATDTLERLAAALNAMPKDEAAELIGDECMDLVTVRHNGGVVYIEPSAKAQELLRELDGR